MKGRSQCGYLTESSEVDVMVSPGKLRFPGPLGWLKYGALGML